MSHAGEGSLQAYLDGELDGTATAELDRHLGACALCAGELESLRSVNSYAAGALALMEAPPAPMLQARAAIARQRTRGGSIRRIGGMSLAKAAMLLLALAGAGAAAIPGSPVRRAVESTIARVAQWLGTEPVPVVQTGSQEAPADAPAVEIRTDGAGVLPENGTVRFVLLPPAAPVDVIVSLSDADVARVETAMEQSDVSFRTRSGLIQVSGLGRGTVRVMIPRNAANATVELNGRVLVSKEGAVLTSAAPGATEAGEEIRLRIGT